MLGLLFGLFLGVAVACGAPAFAAPEGYVPLGSLALRLRLEAPAHSLDVQSAHLARLSPERWMYSLETWKPEGVAGPPDQKAAAAALQEEPKWPETKPPFTGREAVQLAKQLRPAVVVMDIAMPLLNGLEATRQILKSVQTAKVLILSAHSDEAYIVEAIKAGARGYLLKQSCSENVCDAIREVQKGNTFFSASIPRRLHKLMR